MGKSKEKDNNNNCPPVDLRRAPPQVKKNRLQPNFSKEPHCLKFDCFIERIIQIRSLFAEVASKCIEIFSKEFCRLMLYDDGSVFISTYLSLVTFFSYFGALKWAQLNHNH